MPAYTDKQKKWRKTKKQKPISWEETVRVKVREDTVRLWDG